MTTNEIGFKELLKNVFNISNDEELLNSSDFETINLEHISVNESAYEKITNHLMTNSVSFKEFLAINSSLAFGHPNENIIKAIKFYILNNKDNIFQELENSEDLSDYLNKQNIQYYKHLLENTISYDFIKKLVNLSLHKEEIYKDEHLYGIKYLLTNLSVAIHKEFSDWFLSSNRKDLKIIYAYSIVNPYGCINNLDINELNSNILFVRTLSKIVNYNIDRSPRYKKMKKYFYDLNIPEIENLHLLLYHFSIRICNSDNDKKKIEEDIYKASIYLQNLNKEILEQYLKEISYSNLSLIINEIKDNTLKKDLYEGILVSLLEKIDNTEFISKFSIEEANILGVVLLQINKQSLNTLLKDFKDKIDLMNEPYYVYTQHKEWDKNISILFHYLIAIYVYYKTHNQSDFIEYKNKLVAVKKEFIHTSEKEINSILEQIN